MNPLLLIALLQAPPQDPTIDDRIDAFVKGDAAARESLLKAGVIAIRPLQRARDRAPENIDALVWDLKKAAAHPAGSKVSELLERKLDFEFTSEDFRDALSVVQSAAGFPMMLERKQPADLRVGGDDVTFAGKDVPARHALDRICQRVGLDYGIHHNTVVVAAPERLWPEETATAPAFGPSGAERQDKNPAEVTTLDHLRSVKITLDFRHTLATDAFTYIQEFCGLKIAVEPGKKDGLPRLRFGYALKSDRATAFDALCLLTQYEGLDFMIQGTSVLIGPREVIDNRLKGTK